MHISYGFLQRNMENMLKQLFDDKTIGVLSVIQGKKIVQVRETSREANVPPATVFRIFKKLQDIGLLSKEPTGTFNIYKVNKNSDAYFLLEKLIPKTDPLDAFVDELPKDKLENISLLDEAENRASVMIIGSLKHSLIQALVEKIKKQYNFSINTLILSKAQYETLASLHMKPSPQRIIFEKQTL